MESIGIVLKDIMGNSAVFIAGKEAVDCFGGINCYISFHWNFRFEADPCLECSDWICLQGHCLDLP